MRGVSANIMLGQVPPIGTGSVNVLMDTSKLLQYMVLNLHSINEDKLKSTQIEIPSDIDQLTEFNYDI